MDSDSSTDGDNRRKDGGFKKWENRANSDVSDDENFSRGAKSIDSPPESPPRGGGNLDSPPASPAQGVESPHSEYLGSGASSAGGSSPQNPESPTSPRRSPRPRSPQNEDDDDEDNDRRHRRVEANTGRPESPADIESPRSEPLMCPRTPPDSPANSSSPGDQSRKSLASSPGGHSHKSSSESPERRPGGTRFERLERTKNSPPSSPARHRRRPRSPEMAGAAPESPISDDGRSNISSNSSLGSEKFLRRRISPTPSQSTRAIEIKSHGEDLSDVSDIESIGSDIDHETIKDKHEEDDKKDKGSVSGLNALEEAEQLDFEAEEEPKPLEDTLPKPDKESTSDGPTNDKLASGKKPGGVEKDKVFGSGCDDEDDDEEEGEVKELEDGEISDEGDNRPEETEPRPVCRFFSRGQCTWGSSCRFVHPGVTDKGNYTMFDMVRPLVTMNSGPPPPMHMFGGPVDLYGPRPMDRPMMGPGPPFQQPVMRRDEPPGESAWERGLRQAKEMLRRSNKRKETDVDFEEKKMNLSLTGTDEYDKENDYYTRPASPVFPEEPPPPPYHERYSGPPKEPAAEKRYRSVSDRFGDYPPPQFYPPPGARDQWYDERPPGGRFHPHVPRHPQDYDRPRNDRSRGANSVPPEEYYDNRGSRKKYSSREVTVQRSEKSERSWKDASPSPRARGTDRSGNVRGDEWSDPWMRSKSPKRGRPTSRPRKKSYSSHSSYSSSSSSRSSSYSSYSRSRSRSRSSKSPSVSRSRSRSSFSRRKSSPPPQLRRNKSPFSRDRRLDLDRSLHMNPPAPSPRRSSGRTSPPVARRVLTPPSDRSTRNLSAKILAAAMRDRSSSRSSSGSDSSGSSSDSSSDSGSSSSSSRMRSSPQSRVTPKTLTSRKKIDIDEKMAIAHAMKSKAMDALKMSGQKQQIKLTLKGNADRPPQTAPASRKRAAESPPEEDTEAPSAKKKGGAPQSRREELLKQLKAVEDAIARKRSKT